MVEYRAIADDERAAFHDVLAYAFRPEAGPNPERDDEDDEPGLGDERGLFDDGRLVSGVVHRSYELAIRGRWLEVAGVSAVATRPEDRHRGHVRRLLRESLAEYRERGQPFTFLWPFKHPFYRRLGWGRLADRGRYEVDPRDLADLRDHPLAAGRFEPLDPDASIPDLRSLDERLGERADRTMRRSEAWYRHRFFEGWETDPFVYGWYDGGDLRGYVRYQFVEEEGDRVLAVSDVGAPDDAALVNLLGFLSRHGDHADRVRVNAPAHDRRWFDLVDDPRDVEQAVRPGAMGRLVDVRAGLEALPAPAGVEGTLVLDVDDPLADWNDGRFALAARDGAITVEPGDGDGPSAALPVHTLSRLALGTTTASRAALAGGLVADAAARSRLDALFPPREGYLREYF